MRKSILASVLSSAMVLAAAAPAFAAPVTASGNVTVNQSVSLNCTISLDGDRTTSGGVTTIALDADGVRLGAGSSSCPAVELQGTWTATYSGTGSAVPVSIAGVEANSLLGTCGPATISATYNTSTNVLTIPTQSIPGVIFGIPTTCGLGGVLTVV